MHIEEMTAEQIVEVLLKREEGLSNISSIILVDELVERNSNLDMIGSETLVEALRQRDNVDYICGRTDYYDYGMYVEQGSSIHGSGRVTLLAIKDVI